MSARRIKRAALDFAIWRALQSADEETTLRDIAKNVGVSYETVRLTMARRDWWLPGWEQQISRRTGSPRKRPMGPRYGSERSKAVEDVLSFMERNQ